MTRATNAASAVSVERNGESLRLDGELSFASVPGLLAASGDWFEDGSGTLEIDLSSIRRSDSAGVALLVEWLRRARAAGREIRYIDPPPQMRAIIDFCALQRVLPIANGQ